MDKRDQPTVRNTGPIRIFDHKGNPIMIINQKTGSKMIRIANVPPALKNPVLGYRNYWSRDSFQPGEYDLAEISRAADTDSYLSRAFKKKTGLLMKEGFRFIGKNQLTIQYVNKRLAQIERASSYPLRLLLREVASDLIKFSNAYIVKVRKASASGGKVRNVKGMGTLQPVAGYFRVPPETMYFKRDQNGHVIKYQQKILAPLTSPKTGKWPEWKPQDVIHLYHDRKGGFAVGTPDTIPVLDDVRVLRRMEEDVELLVYQHLFPLYHYMVGTENAPAQVYDDGTTEVDQIRNQIEDMPSEGCLVTPERHQIEVKGSQGKSLKADPFLEHFKQRVWAGLAMSAIDYGEGSTANRNTADALSQALVDCVKDFQSVLEIFFDFFVIGELLQESTFTFDVLDEMNMVHMQFNEIDVEQKIKRDSNAVNLFQGHLMTETEARKELGEEPLLDDQRQDMFFERVEKPRLIIQALDEPFTPEAKAALEAGSAPSAPQAPSVVSPKPGRTAKGKSRGGKAAANKVQPENQHGKKAGPEKRKSSSDPRFLKLFDTFREAAFLLIFRDLLDQVKLHDHTWRRTVARLVETVVVNKYNEYIRGHFYTGLRDVGAFQHAVNPIARVRIKEVQTYAANRIGRLTDRVLDTIESLVLQGHGKDTVRSALDSFKFRADFLDRTVRRQAKTYGQAIGLLLLGNEAVYVHRSDKNAEPCEICDPFAGRKLSLEHLTITDIPPWHDNCECPYSLSAKPLPSKMIDMKDQKKKPNPEDKLVGKNKRIKDEMFDQKELHLGIALEFEHTDNVEVAKAITKDHLAQYPLYYSSLADMEEEGHEALEQAEEGDDEALEADPEAKEYEPEGEGPGLHRHVSDNDFDRKELLIGIETEAEHTDDMAIAKELAKDHLSELPDYYTRLKQMEANINELMDQHIHEQSDGEYMGPPEENPDGEGHIHLMADGENFSGPGVGPHGLHTHVQKGGPKGKSGPPVFEREYDEPEISDQQEDLTAKEERCVLSVKKDLRQRHPTWSSQRIKSSAIAICRASMSPGTKKDAGTSGGKRQNNACMKAARSAIRRGNKGLTTKEINALAERICKMHALQPKPTPSGVTP